MQYKFVAHANQFVLNPVPLANLTFMGVDFVLSTTIL